jgi:hypothetical protein
MSALRTMGRIPANPIKPEAGPVDPGKVLRGEQDLSTETMLDSLAALGGKSAEEVFAMDQQGNLVKAFLQYCLALMRAMGPEKLEAPAPKE